VGFACLDALPFVDVELAEHLGGVEQREQSCRARSCEVFTGGEVELVHQPPSSSGVQMPAVRAPGGRNVGATSACIPEEFGADALAVSRSFPADMFPDKVSAGGGP
jgi:hypothetical protein